MNSIPLAALLALAGCSAGAAQGSADYEVECEGIGTHLNGISGEVSDISALPAQTFRVSKSRETVSRVLAGGTPDNLCLAGSKCTVSFKGDKVRMSSVRKDATVDFFHDRRSGAAYYVMLVPLATGKTNISSWQMSCADRA